MRTITNLEISLLANELNNEFKDSFIEKFYEIHDNFFLIKTSKEHKKYFLQIILCHTINKTNYIPGENNTPTNFSLAVRKRIVGFKIGSVMQYNDDRIILIKLNKHELVLFLIIEMFGKGNFIITDESFKIMLAYNYHTFKDRSIEVESIYKPPQQIQKIQQYNKNNSSNDNNGEVRESPPTTQTIKANKYFIYRDENDKIIHYSINEDPKFNNYKKNELTSLQEALDLFYHNNTTIKEEKSEFDKKIEELNSSIKKQEMLIKELNKERENNLIIGSIIMNNMYIINQIIEELKNNKKINKEELNKKIEGIKVLNIDLKNKTVLIDI